MLLQPSVPDARYANYFSVGNADCEVVLEFGQYYQGDEQPMPHTRIIVSPINAKRLLALLGETLEQYVAQRGPISPGIPEPNPHE